MKLRTLSIASSLLYGVVLAIIAGLIAYTSWSIEDLKNQQTVVSTIDRAGHDLSYLSNSYLLYHQESQVRLWQSNMAEFSANLERLKPRDPEQRALVRNLEANRTRLQAIFDSVANSIQTGRQPVNGEFLQVSWSRMEVQNRGIVSDTSRLSDLLGREADQLNLINTLVISALVLSFGIFILSSYFLTSRRTLRGIAALQTGTRIVGTGDLQFSIEHNRGDEIGELCTAFNAMTAALASVTASKADLEREISERQTAEAKREQLLVRERELVTELAAANEALQEQNEELAAGEEELRTQNEDLLEAHLRLEEESLLRQAMNSSNELLASTLQYEEILARIVPTGARALGSDVAVLEEWAGESWLVRETFGLPKSMRDLLMRPGEHSIRGPVTTEGGTFVVDDPDSDARVNAVALHRYGMKCALVVPLVVRGRAFGIILFGSTQSGCRFREAHLEFARNFSAAASLALENARLYEEQKNISLLLQRALLDIPEAVQGLEIGHIYRSATEQAAVGGDFYDLLQLREGWIGILVGDVSGHGVQAARVATMVKDVVVAFSYRSRRPDTVLRQTNRLLVEKGIEGFVTLFLAILNPSTGVLVYSSAGHPNPLLWRSDGQIELLQVGSPPLGVFDSHPWRAIEVQLEEQDILLAYTDGAMEARRDGRLFGQEGLVDALRGRQGLSMKQLPEALLADIMTFSNGVLSDDVALLALRLTGPDRAVKPAHLIGGRST